MELPKTPIEAMVRAIKSWGITFDETGNMFTPDGKRIKVAWKQEGIDEIREIHSVDVSMDVATIVLSEVMKALYPEKRS